MSYASKFGSTLPLMSSAAPSEPPPPSTNNSGKQPENETPSTGVAQARDATEMDTTPDRPPEENWLDIPAEIMVMETDDILTRIRLIELDINVSHMHYSSS